MGHHPEIVERRDALLLSLYRATLAILAHLGGDTADLPDIEPLGDDWRRDVRRVHRDNVEEARRQNIPLSAFLP